MLLDPAPKDSGGFVLIVTEFSLMVEPGTNENLTYPCMNVGVDGGSAKEALEREKPRLEIEEFSRWWRRPAYIQSVFSILIA